MKADWNMDRPRQRSIATVSKPAGWIAMTLLGGLTLGLFVWAGINLFLVKEAVDRDELWTDTVTRGTLTWEVAAAGSLHPANTRVVSTLIAGQVVERHLEVGDALKPGTRIVTLENLSEKRRQLEIGQDLQMAQAELSELMGELETRALEREKVRHELAFELQDARRRAEASRSLGVGVLPEIEILRLEERVEALETLLSVEEKRAHAAAASAGAQVQQQRTRVVQLERLKDFQDQVVDSLQIRSTVTGVLKTLPVQPGQWLAEGIALAEVVEPGELIARLQVPESAAAALRTGLAARLNARGIELEGVVSRIDPAVSAGTITVDIDLESAPETLRNDLSIQGYIELDRLENVLSVTRPVGVDPQTSAQLYRLNEKVVEPVVVGLGRVAGDRIEVKSGLSAGDQIVLSQAGNSQRNLSAAR
ncbi:MAG: HlyD family efflux transporter periplasmic adaptor subunit [Pseudomonadota bacterium]